MRVSYTQVSIFQPSPRSTTSQYVAINYGSASAAESKHPEYSGSMTHQIGAVQGAANENTSHFSTLQPTRSISGGRLVCYHCSLVVIMCITSLFMQISVNIWWWGDVLHCSVLRNNRNNELMRLYTQYVTSVKHSPQTFAVLFKVTMCFQQWRQQLPWSHTAHCFVPD